MSRVGIITIQKCNNYGADLQAYALQAAVRRLGHDCENIDYVFYKNPRHQKGTQEGPIFRPSIVNTLKERLFPALALFKCYLKQMQKKEREARFASFFRENIQTGREYRSVDSLYEDPPDYDVYMVGSDQVWNPRLFSNLKPYFLDFVPQGRKCVSYASSFGVGTLSGKVYGTYKTLLKRFSFIGLREQRGQMIVRSMALKAEVKHVLDPTLLLTAKEWGMVASEPRADGKNDFSKPYLLAYELILSPELEGLASRWAVMHNWQVVYLDSQSPWGPAEFVWLFEHASAVVTNSFHGTAFSVLYEKPFWVLFPKGMKNSSRITSLLASLTLLDRIISPDVIQQINLDQSLSNETIRARLANLREESVAFLNREIEDEPIVSEVQLPRSCWAAWNTDEAVRAQSTSGGIFRALADEVILNQGVVFGAAFSNDFKTVRHLAARASDELGLLMKSKYVYSDVSKAIPDAVEYLKAGKTVLFTGTPCQVAMMKKAAAGVDEALLTCDIVCHGTPRPAVFTAYIDELEKRYSGKISSYEFRDKRCGWNFPMISYSINGKNHHVLPGHDAYFHGFSICAFLRKCCYSCKFASLSRVSDITIADCWRIAASHPEYDDEKGISLVLANSQKGEHLMRKLRAAGSIYVESYSMDLAQIRNAPLMSPPEPPACYPSFSTIFEKTNSFEQASQCYCSTKIWLRNEAVSQIKRLGWAYLRKRQ